MNLLDKYVAEVGKQLPLLKGREDVEKELKSTLEDMLEDKEEQAGRPRDEAMEIELLKEYGSPQRIASSYNPHPYLIGPRMFPFFLMVLKIVLTVVIVVMLVLSSIKAVTAFPLFAADFMQVIMQGFGNALSTAIAAFGNVVIVFAILERILPEKEMGDFSNEKDWDPASLAKQPDPDMVKRGDLIAEVVFTALGLAFLNGLFNLPVFTKEFLQFIPWINAVFLAEIILDVYLLFTAKWNTPGRIAKVIIEAVGIAITVILIRTPNLTLFTNESLLNFIKISEEAGAAGLAAYYTTSITLIVILIIQGIELAKALYELLRINYRKK
ncbi:MAG TPA: hypothetical protein PKK96_07520 [Anaerolineales bacterium]|nr:hypothetical protein [Anaerolineales bacterium]HNQ94306.1 hypothetical protein [Anaerolineales bacterium]HNS60837.1 hypothetical protein [Anaerolineales bacterium]